MWPFKKRRGVDDFIKMLATEVGLGDVEVGFVSSSSEIVNALPSFSVKNAENIYKTDSFVLVRREKGRIKLLVSPTPPSEFEIMHAIAMAYIMRHSPIRGLVDVTMPLLNAIAHFVGAALFGPRYWEEAKREWRQLAELATRRLASPNHTPAETPVYRIIIAAEPIFEDDELALTLGRMIVEQPTPENVAHVANMILRVANVYARADPTRKYVIITLGANPE